MDELVKVVAFGALAAFLAVGTMVGYRIMHDQVLLYVVVIGVLVIMLVVATGGTFAMLHRFSHTEAELMDAYSANDLTRARRERTRPVPQISAGGSHDLLGTFLAGASAGEIVDGQVTYPDGGQDDD